MENDDGKTVPKLPHNNAPPEPDSLSLSMSLSLPSGEQKSNETENISEHISFSNESPENDRSFQEIEVSNHQAIYINPDLDKVENNSYEKQFCGLDTSLQSEGSIISLNYLEKIENDYVHNILEDIIKEHETKSDKETIASSKDESFNIFQNLDLDDQSISDTRASNKLNLEENDNIVRESNQSSLSEKNFNITNFGLEPISGDVDLIKKLKDFEELIAIKDSAIAALACELDSFREVSNTNTVSTLSTTEYKQLQDEWHGKLLDFNNAIVYKNDLIQHLTESLDQSVKDRKELLLQIEDLKNEISGLKEKTGHQVDERNLIQPDNINPYDIKTEINLLTFSLDKHVEKEYLELEKSLSKQQQELLNELNSKFNNVMADKILENKNMYDKEFETMQNDFEMEKGKYETEISRLKSMLAEFQSGAVQVILTDKLKKKHSEEMEELRTYFEKKCAEFEKNYSDEIFSHQSRKMSSSSCSEAELTSDLPLSHTPGPEGDILHEIQPKLNKKEVINLQNELNSIINKINKCDLDTMTDESFLILQNEINKSNLGNLLRYDISLGKNRHRKLFEKTDNISESTVDEIQLKYEKKLKEIEDRYEEDIENLKSQLETLEKYQLGVSLTVQEVGSPAEYEINEVIQSYQRKLQEQVNFAKIDIISALETQIQYLAASESYNEEWPSELLRLRDKFTEKHRTEIEALNEEHTVEIEKLKEEHLKVLNGALERGRTRSSKDGDSLNKGDAETLKEIETLKRRDAVMRSLVKELFKYMNQCEDELNNTVIDELVKHGIDKSASNTEDELNLTQSSHTSSSKTSDGTFNITKVHWTPNFTDLMNIIQSSPDEEGDCNISIDLKNELSACLEKLKSEANAILTLTNNVTKKPVDESGKVAINLEQITPLKGKLIMKSEIEDDLKAELEENQRYIETLEKERERLETELDRVISKDVVLEEELVNARNKIGQLLESGRREIVSEGYGEGGAHLTGSGDSTNLLAELQEKARNVISQTRSSADSTLLHLIEDLCRVGEKIKDESTKERHDLIQQIEVADKKYRTTQKFLDEQAVEREQERDEAQKRIDHLYSQLKDKDKDKVNSEMAASEANGVYGRRMENRYTFLKIEQLEHQLQEKSSELETSAQKYKELELERNEAVEKIKVLRDIIRDFEAQIESKSEEIRQYLDAINKLQTVIVQQEGLDGNKENPPKDVIPLEVLKHIDNLENEIQQLRLQSELAGNEGATKQIRTQLYEIESQIDKRIKELETLHSTASTNCSSPSEDVSARDLVLPKSPKNMEDCEVPLQQLARLREKLIRHSRAEEAAMKRIRDLEMQVFGLKQELEETSGEREYMKKQIQEQLVLISDFQIRLDEQRIRADNIEKLTNTSLEHKIYDLQNEITCLMEKLQQKDKHINNQLVLLKETQDRLNNLENEVSSSKDDDIIVDMQKEIEKLRRDNDHMKKKIENESRMVPNLVGNIISDKNHDMERLRLKLEDTEKLLEAYTSLSLDKKDLETLADLKNNGTSWEELFGISQMRRMESRNESETLSPRLFVKGKRSDDTSLDPEISSILGPNAVNSIVQARNSTEISNKRVHFENLEDLKKEIHDLKNSVEAKDKIINEYEERIKLLTNLETKIEKVQQSLEDTEKTLASASERFEKEQKELKDRERDLGVELAEKKLLLEEKSKELDVLQRDSKRKDDMCTNLTKEIKNLEKSMATLKLENVINVDNILKGRNLEMDNMRQQLLCKYKSENDKWKRQTAEYNDVIARLTNELNIISADLDGSLAANKMLEETNEENTNEIRKLNKQLDNKNVQIESITSEMNSLREKLNKKRKIIRDLEEMNSSQKTSLMLLQREEKEHTSILLDKECSIDILKQDADRYQKDIALLETEIKKLKGGDVIKLKEELKIKEDKIVELNGEKKHLVELLHEKDKIIINMTADGNRLHENLITIQNKLKEPGSIIDMGFRFRDEQKKTAELLREVYSLKAQIMECKCENKDIQPSVDEDAVSDHSLNSISETPPDVKAYKKALAKEKADRKHFVVLVNQQQATITELQEELKQTRNELWEKDVKNLELEKEMDSLRRKNISSASKSESTEYKEPPNKNAILLNQLRKDYDVLQGEKNLISNEFASLQQSNVETQTNLKSTKDLLALEIGRRENLEDKVQDLQIQKKELKESLVHKNLEMEKIVDEMSREKAELIQQKLELLQKVKSHQALELQTQSAPPTAISDELLNKIKDLNNALIDNKKLMDLITRISNEKKYLENELEIIKGTIKNDVPDSDLIARVDYLFAKTLKLESIKKALVFQKRYLMRYILTHQRPAEALPHPINHRIEFKLNFTSKHRFRAVVFVVISIVRMKFLVRRWHSGGRIAEKINSRHFKRTHKTNEPVVVTTHFQVGLPVYNQPFLNAPRRNLNPFIDCTEDNRDNNDRLQEEDRDSVKSRDEYMERSIPWSGVTPPSKDKKHTPFRNEDLNPLTAPQLLSHYVDRFDQIQKTLGAVRKSNSS